MSPIMIVVVMRTRTRTTSAMIMTRVYTYKHAGMMATVEMPSTMLHGIHASTRTLDHHNHHHKPHACMDRHVVKLLIRFQNSSPDLIVPVPKTMCAHTNDRRTTLLWHYNYFNTRMHTQPHAAYKHTLRYLRGHILYYAYRFARIITHASCMHIFIICVLYQSIDIYIYVIYNI